MAGLTELTEAEKTAAVIVDTLQQPGVYMYGVSLSIPPYVMPCMTREDVIRFLTDDLHRHGYIVLVAP